MFGVLGFFFLVLGGFGGFGAWGVGFRECQRFFWRFRAPINIITRL